MVLIRGWELVGIMEECWSKVIKFHINKNNTFKKNSVDGLERWLRG